MSNQYSTQTASNTGSFNNDNRGRHRNYEKILEDRRELFEEAEQRPRDSTSLQIDEPEFMQRTNYALDDFLLQGQASLTNLREQRNMLKSARGRALNSASTLGVSKNLIQFIERRSTQDWYLFFAVVILTCILIFFIMY
ncbi:protein transport protein bos1 [Entomophthora muscae]|uniref:Protein transport protein bos1 n=1 Tax=Entomophthora muscae TaxID=34485 RepID=A0ACC2S578_9FUNG|nr:protein transport protein bos1 [Entomophthora muscae]